MSMSISYEETGRTQQKARTRNALIAATRELLAQGLTPTVEDAAAAASISRATAYRYFPNQNALLVAAYPEIEARSLLGPNPPEDAESRLEALVQELARFTVENEPQLRTMLRLSLEPDPAHRGELLLRRGRAIAWIEDALAPLSGQMPDAELHRLALAIRCAVGIEALVWLTDIPRLSREAATDVMRWSAHALLQSALAETTASGRRGQASPRGGRDTHARPSASA
jgi:AcrR family transcriptional regulator